MLSPAQSAYTNESLNNTVTGTTTKRELLLIFHRSALE